MSDILSVRGLRVAYGNMQALHGVDLSVSQGCACVVLGANGAGKSTLMRGISGFERFERGRVTGGTVEFAGRNITGRSPSSTSREGLQLVAERESVFLQLTVAENLRIAAASNRKHDGASPAETSELIAQLFPVLGKRERQTAGLLSGGERQMLGVAMRLHMNPSLLLLDEISFGLAPAAVTMMFDALAEIKKRSGLSMLIVEQNIAAALGVADYVYLLRNGSIGLHGTAAEMRGNPAIFQEYVGVAS